MIRNKIEFYYVFNEDYSAYFFNILVENMSVAEKKTFFIFFVYVIKFRCSYGFNFGAFYVIQMKY